MPIVLPSDLSTELAAVNVLLRVIGEQPVQSIDPVESADAESARDTIQEWSRSVQARGWHWNREDAFPLSPNSDGEVLLPANCSFVSKAYWDAHGSSPCKFSERGRKLYDREHRTYVWTSDVYVDMILQLEWDELPEYARQAIIYKAAHDFQMRELTSSTVARVTEEDVSLAWATLEQREDEADTANAVTGNKHVQNSLSGRLQRRT